MHDEEEGGEKILSREGEVMKSPEKNIEKGDSVKNFEERFKDQMEGVARKAVGAKGTEATEAVNQEALCRLMSGVVAGMGLEKLNVGINWMQSFGVVLQFEMEWPESFKEFFSFLKIFTFNFGIFMGIGGAVTIVLSLLIPAYLIYEFDAGLTRERKYFGYWQ
ncbi:hypothetical protein TrLO_g10349 [Triparma laevis f. longispina]|uniref:Uncharacterized protein n=1 Tax=Triparma laevis f. longispina TaxID=1714387 RepID=A0A9W7DQJ3_9STRA|nr:hypothetical protein TrLO_g10349 [Triparma laevis f. longispina]